MIVEDQSEVETFLRAELATAEIIDTHISKIFLGDDVVFKLKRAVKFPYVDFSTPERRLAACESELALNRRTAPSLYRAARRVTRDGAGRLALDGAGALVDAAVEMRRFDGRNLLDALATRGALSSSIVADLAHRIAVFHRGAEVSTTGGGVSGMAAVLDINDRSLRATGLADVAEADALAARFRAALDRLAPLLEARRAAGKVRRCHGDLILRNICLYEGTPTLFDCLEFDADLATIDVLYDLAFLLMDLWHRGLNAQANVLFNRYLDEADEDDGLVLVSFFVATRAAVRAHVTGARAAEAPREEAETARREARAYLDLAERLLEAPPPRLVAIGGLSGSGKSTIAAALAPELGAPPGARVLATDRLRKRLFGARPEARLPADAYRPEVSRQVYGQARERARAALAAGRAAIAEAVFDRPDDRTAIEEVARELGIPFQGLWLQAPFETMKARVAARVGDDSDATPEILEARTRRDLGAMTWPTVDASGDVEKVVADARTRLALAPRAPLPLFAGEGLA